MRSKWFHIAATVAFFLCSGSPASAQRTEELHLYEQKIKAGLVYNFLKYTDWPPGTLHRARNRLQVCLFGGDAFDGYLYPLEGKTAQQNTITISNIYNIYSTKSCHILYIHKDKKNVWPELAHFLKGKPVLTVSDMNNFSKEGGMVEMARIEGRISLYINDEEANASGIKIQDRILKLARHVSTAR